MGAALAAMAAFQIVCRYPLFKNRLYLIQFGAPRYARKRFAEWLNTQLEGRIIQYSVPFSIKTFLLSPIS